MYLPAQPLARCAARGVFLAEAFFASLIANVITAVEESAFQVEVAEIGKLERAFPDVDAAVFDAMRYRANQYRGRAIKVLTEPKPTVTGTVDRAEVAGVSSATPLRQGRPT